MIMGSQVRGARAMVKMKVAELAEAAQVAPNTVVRLEADKGVNLTTLAAIQRALEEAGVEFIERGVRLREG